MILMEYDQALHIRSEKKLSYEEGERYGMQQGIRLFTLIRDSLDAALSPEDTIQRLQQEFSITEQQARDYVSQYQQL